MRYLNGIAVAVVLLLIFSIPCSARILEPGEVITPEKAALVSDLLSPGNQILVLQGLRLKIVPTRRLEWPPPYKNATEKYAPQVRLNDRGELENYVAGLPFPFIDPNDPQAATKVVWNFSYGPQFGDAVEIRKVETGSYRDLGPARQYRALDVPR
jgi:hypothetical protein